MSLTQGRRFKPSIKYFGQVVIGPPGAGKTTYCIQMVQLLKKLGRKVILVNLDPANDSKSYKPDIDIRRIITVEEIMEDCKIGPNAALVYCMEYLEEHLKWLLNKFQGDNGTNYIFDLPGQVELYCHNDSLANIFSILSNVGNIQLCVVHLVDSHHCTDAGKFIAALMLSLSAMLKIGLPHVNLLTKVDLLQKHMDKLPFGIDFFTEVLDLNHLLECSDNDSFMNRHKKFNSALASIIENYSLVSFQLVNIFKDESLLKVKNLIDKANGYVFKAEEGRHINSMLACAMGVEPHNTDNEIE